jgi:hypothetical protein
MDIRTRVLTAKALQTIADELSQAVMDQAAEALRSIADEISTALKPVEGPVEEPSLADPPPEETHRTGGPSMTRPVVRVPEAEEEQVEPLVPVLAPKPEGGQPLFDFVYSQAVAFKETAENDPAHAIAVFAEHAEEVQNVAATQMYLRIGESTRAVPLAQNLALKRFLHLKQVMTETAVQDLDVLSAMLTGPKFKRPSDLVDGVDLVVMQFLTEGPQTFQISDAAVLQHFIDLAKTSPGALDTAASSLVPVGVEWVPLTEELLANPYLKCTNVEANWNACLDMLLMADMVADQLVVLTAGEEVSPWWNNAKASAGTTPSGVLPILHGTTRSVLLKKHDSDDVMTWAVTIPGWEFGQPLSEVPITGADLLSSDNESIEAQP